MKKFLLILSIAIVFPFANLKASHFAGSDMTYTCLGGNTYLISISFYRDCSGVSAPSSITINFHCTSNPQFNFSAILSKIPNTGQEITPACSSNPSKCAGGNNYGISEYVYQTQVTLVPCSWEMNYSSCCRNPVTTTSASGGWYIMAKLNNLMAPCNSSPSFTNKPIVVAINNQHLKYTHGAYDMDGDSLVYSFFAPKTTINAHVSYLSPYDSVNFISSSTPITINPLTGELDLTPNLVSVGVSGVKVDEYRNIGGTPTLIGTVYRDIQLKIYSSTNNANPVLAGMNFSGDHSYSANDSIYTKNIQAGSVVSFTIAGYDSDTLNSSVGGHPENFSLSWNNGIPAGIFSAHNNGTDSAWADFSWTTGLEDISPSANCFSVEIEDYACPYNGKQIFSYCLTVFPPPLWLGNDTTICLSQQLTLDADSGNYIYQWSTGDTTQSITLVGNTLGLGNHAISLIRTGYGLTFYDTINILVDPCTYINDPPAADFFSINPNPNHGVFTISMDNPEREKIGLTIFNIEGKLVFSKDILNPNDIMSQKIDLSDLPSGVYFVKIKIGELTKSKKLIIH